jgi:heat shock protein HslJ
VESVHALENIFLEFTMEKLRLNLVVLFIVLGMLLGACSANASASGSLTGTWALVSYGDPADLTPAAQDVETSIRFNEEGKLEGNVGCNGFGADYTVDGNTISFGPIISTLMLCEGPVGDQETATLNVFAESAAFTLQGDTLTITSADGSTAVVLARK